MTARDIVANEVTVATKVLKYIVPAGMNKRTIEEKELAVARRVFLTLFTALAVLVEAANIVT